MNIVEVSRVMSLEAAIAMKDAIPGHHEPHEARPTTIFMDSDTGKPVLALASYPGNFAEYRAAFRGTQFQLTPRSSGLANQTCNFGYVCRRPMLKRVGCGISTLARDEPAIHHVY